MTEPPYHDVTGSGPVLLLVPGGAGHPMGLGPLVDRLASRFTVVTYDPLGLAHGRLGLAVPDQRPADWSEGAHRVLDAVLPAGERAYVCGTSSGGVAALDLLQRHPRRLAHVVAHEPPCVTVLPDGPERARGADRPARRARSAGRRGPLRDPDGCLPRPCPAPVHRPLPRLRHPAGSSHPRRGRRVAG